MKKTIVTAVILTMAAIFFVFSVPASALGETVDLSYVRQNESGQGYRWDNINDVLYLTDVNLSTTADFGFKLPAGTTVDVEGECFVSAERYAISCLGSVTFKGTGKLTVSGGECGMYFYSTNRDHKILFLSGEYVVTGGEQAIRSDGAELAFCGGKLSLEGKISACGVDVTVSGCDITASGPLSASHVLSVSGANVSAFAENESALMSDGRIAIENVKIETGESSDALAVSEKYDGESAVRLTSTYKRVRSSVLFGEGTPGYVDTIVFIAAGVGVVAAFVIPFIIKARKRKKLNERLKSEK